MATDTYEVLAPELTLHRQVGELKDPLTKEVTGIQQGRGRTVYAGTVVSAAELSPILREALENEDHPSYDYVMSVLRPVDEDVNEEVFGEPIAGYDGLEEASILGVMRVLPSAQVQAIKRYEENHGARPAIVNYSIGFGESPEQRQTGGVSSPLVPADTSKPVSAIRTRTVEDDTIVQPGEGITGTGERAIAPGTAAEMDDDAGEGDDDADKPAKKVVQRRGRRARGPASSTASSPDDSSDDSTSDNSE